MSPSSPSVCLVTISMIAPEMRHLLFNTFIIEREISPLSLGISQNNGITITGWIFTRQSRELFPKLLLLWVENRSNNNKNKKNNNMYKTNNKTLINYTRCGCFIKRLILAFSPLPPPPIKTPKPQTTQNQTEVKKKHNVFQNNYSAAKWHNLLNWSLEKSVQYEKWLNP